MIKRNLKNCAIFICFLIVYLFFVVVVLFKDVIFVCVCAQPVAPRRRFVKGVETALVVDGESLAFGIAQRLHLFAL